jgi:hypothetical protein
VSRSIAFPVAALAVSLAWSPTLRAQEPANDALPDPRLQRATDDVRKVAESVLATPHAYTGTCTWAENGEPTLREPVAFRGAFAAGVHYFELGEHRVLTHGDRQLVSKNGGEWTLPQGHQPDCPLSPTALAQNLGKCEVAAFAPTSHQDRPAMGVYATWSGNRAERTVDAVCFPGSREQALLERIAVFATKEDATKYEVRVDSTLRFDPATRSLYTATLRIALMAPTEDDEAKPRAEELPALPTRAWITWTATVAMVDGAEVPMPDLDEATRERLGLGKPEATPEQTPARQTPAGQTPAGQTPAEKAPAEKAPLRRG